MSRSHRRPPDSDGHDAAADADAASDSFTVSLHPDAFLSDEDLRRAVEDATGRRLDDQPPWTLIRRSIDARRGRTRIVAVFERAAATSVRPGHAPVDQDAPQEPGLLGRDATRHELPLLAGEPSVLIIGAGPAGLFCAWQLAQLGIRARVVERGKPVAARRHDIAALSQRGELDADSNYCFGEGGAGTFSDGKLYTRSDKRGPVRAILEALVSYGASAEILVDARPHIGTNKLPRVITSMREDLIRAGVQFEFDTRIDSLIVHDGIVKGAITQHGDRIEARSVVVAPGHSAPDVLAWLKVAGATLEFKTFAVGVRIEHPQPLIDRLQYHELAGHPVLGAASYRLVERTAFGNAWSFCMCPGGYVVCAATHPRRQVVNGMSPSQRRGRYANSGFVTEVGPSQLVACGEDPNDPFAGLRLVEALEERAFQAGGGAFVGPAQTLRDFVEDRASKVLPDTSYHRGVVPARLDDILGSPLAHPLRAALVTLEAKMPGFVQDGAVAIGVESRTSSPVRIVRDPQTLASPSLRELYPCGEGAGYAGGIVSAALDGMAVAAAIARARG